MKPHEWLKPTLFYQHNKWFAVSEGGPLVKTAITSGAKLLRGQGDTPLQAVQDFDNNFLTGAVR